MKKLTTLAIIIAISTFCVAQKSITEITGGEILWGWTEDSYIAFPDYDGTINYTYDQVNAILQPVGGIKKKCSLIKFFNKKKLHNSLIFSNFVVS